MSRPIHAIIHQDALRHNLKIARQHVPESEVFAVVKANAYGHGIERVYDALKSADGFALLDIDEAVRLRKLGWSGKILLLEGIFREQDLSLCAQLNLSFTLHNHDQLLWLQNFARQSHDQHRFNIFLKLNSGMNRLGFAPEHYSKVWHVLNGLTCVASITHMTHFSDADGERFGLDGVTHQLRCFEDTIQSLPGLRSVSNSAAILRHHANVQSNIVRSGIMLYGSSPDFPSHSIDDWQLKPTLSLRSELIAIQQLKPHQTVGYGSQFIAQRETRVGVVACGYADGYQRITAAGTPVLVDHQRTHIIGRISMDMLTVDLTHLPSAQIGSEVVLWGVSSQGVVLPIDEVAAGSTTVGYELMCGVTRRVNFSIESISI